jgi:hypothetical protein
MDEPDMRALAAVVQQPGDQEIRVRRSGGAKSGKHLEAVAAIRDLHSIEQRHLGRRQPGRQLVAFSRGNPSPNVHPGPFDLRGPPSTHVG